MPIDGRTQRFTRQRHRLVLDGDLALPPGARTESPRPSPAGVELDLGAAAARRSGPRGIRGVDRAPDIRALVDPGVRERIAPDLGAAVIARARRRRRHRRRLHDVRARLPRPRDQPQRSRRASSPACGSTAIASSAIAGPSAGPAAAGSRSTPRSAPRPPAVI